MIFGLEDKVRFGLLLTFALAFTGVAVGASVAEASENRTYKCRTGTVDAYVETIPEEGRAQYTGPDDIASLQAMPNGAFVSGNSGISFQTTGQGGTLWLGDVSFPCQVTTARAPVAPPPPTVLGGPEQLNHVGQSLGGRLRAGPGTSYPQIGSLEEGTYLTILSNTGVSFDGYDWFEVVLDNGQRGFQWGGILCSNGGQLVGLYASCQNIPR